MTLGSTTTLAGAGAGPGAASVLVAGAAPGGSGEGAGGSVHAGTKATAKHGSQNRIAASVTAVRAIAEIFGRL